MLAVGWADGSARVRLFRVDARAKVLQAGGIGYPRQIERRYLRRLLARAKAAHAFVTARLRERFQSLALQRSDAAVFPEIAALDVSELSGLLRIVTEARLAFVAEFPPDPDVLSTTARDVDLFNSRATTKILRTVVGIDPVAPGLEELHKQWANTNAALIKSIDARYFADVADVVAEAARAGRSTKDLARDIEARFGVSKSRAKLIARDQVAKLNGQISKERQTSVGIERYEWQTSEDERVRPEHRERNGRIFSWDEPPPDGHPGQPINCRCVALPVFDEVPVEEPVVKAPVEEPVVKAPAEEPAEEPEILAQIRAASTSKQALVAAGINAKQLAALQKFDAPGGRTFGKGALIERRLGGRLGGPKATPVATVEALEKKGLIAVSRAPGKLSTGELTEKGKRMLAAIEDVVGKGPRFAPSLTPEDVKQLFEDLARK